ncbi:MAG TPA: hypothetical protein VF449_08145, partial [Parvibaculum sp.]
MFPRYRLWMRTKKEHMRRCAAAAVKADHTRKAGGGSLPHPNVTGIGGQRKGAVLPAFTPAFTLTSARKIDYTPRQMAVRRQRRRLLHSRPFVSGPDI